MLGLTQAQFEELLRAAYISGNAIALQSVARISSGLHALDKLIDMSDVVFNHMDISVQESDYVIGLRQASEVLMDILGFDGQFPNEERPVPYPIVYGIRGEELLTDAHWDALEATIDNTDEHFGLAEFFNRTLILFDELNTNFSDVYWHREGLEFGYVQGYLSVFYAIVWAMGAHMVDVDQHMENLRSSSELNKLNIVTPAGMPLTAVVYVPEAERYEPPKHARIRFDPESPENQEILDEATTVRAARNATHIIDSLHEMLEDYTNYEDDDPLGLENINDDDIPIPPGD